jgi:hypothetical protein
MYLRFTRDHNCPPEKGTGKRRRYPRGWMGTVDDALGRAAVEAGHAVEINSKVEAGSSDDDLTVDQVLSMADESGVTFHAFKAAAAKLLGDDTPSKKDDIVAALKALPPEQTAA